MGDCAIIQKDRGEFVNANGFTAWQGFDERGYEIQFFEWEQMSVGAVPVSEETVVVGSVAFVRRALALLGIVTHPIDYPACLVDYLGRRIWSTTWSEVRSRVDDPGIPIFVKPADRDKAFSGYVVAAFRDLIRTAGLTGDMKLWASDPLPFLSEWRFFVHKGEIVGTGHYKGDPLIFPDAAVVRRAVADFAATAPVSYGIDFGIREGGGSYLVEVNDGYSLGCYGLKPLAYSALLRDRWFQLTRDRA